MENLGAKPHLFGRIALRFLPIFRRFGVPIYTYWYKKRSGWCEDGSSTPGCAGQQGGDPYFYGNMLRPPNQTPFARDT
ncbi:MAG: hypothetical protein GY822_14965 [Deltaproteobacteria bacterium]|nr:hypothetical protein [Deltaproteobacteria bacterium]